jgi:hypothetical protein
MKGSGPGEIVTYQYAVTDTQVKDLLTDVVVTDPMTGLSQITRGARDGRR